MRAPVFRPAMTLAGAPTYTERSPRPTRARLRKLARSACARPAEALGGWKAERRETRQGVIPRLREYIKAKIGPDGVAAYAAPTEISAGPRAMRTSRPSERVAAVSGSSVSARRALSRKSTASAMAERATDFSPARPR
jgi:hypothetical protein